MSPEPRLVNCGRVALAGLVILGAACARYTAAPVRPDSQLELFNQRRLGDQGLLTWFDSAGVTRPDTVWSARQLALAAVWFRPDRGRWAAEVAQADAAVRTAGARPGLDLSGDLEYAFSNPGASSRWGVALAGLFTVELGGKRAARVARARAQALTVRAGVMQSAWELVSQVYQASFALARAEESLALASVENDRLDTVLALSRTRYEEGSIGRLELARVEEEAASARAAYANLTRGAAAARAGVAAAAGIPVAALGAARVSAPPSPGCAIADTAARPALQRQMLGARWALRRAAAEYQVAEGDLRLEVANAAPNLTLGPGVFFDQGTGKFTLASALPLLPLHRNRGPIAEAEARRAAAGARLAEVQEMLLNELEGALSECAALRRSVPVVDSAGQLAAMRADLARAAYERGESGRLDVALAELDVVRARRHRLELTAELERAGLALERTLGAWGLWQEGPWPTAILPGPWPGRGM